MPAAHELIDCAEGVAVAPGRVNLIGEHTDYNDGFVLPMAIDRGVRVAFRRRHDRLIRAHTTLGDAACEIDLDHTGASRGSGWASYIAGVAWAMQSGGQHLRGADLLIDSTLAAGTGLSSSAALELATHIALSAVAGTTWDPMDAARTAQRAENEFVGVPCGIMDQMAAACSRAGHAMLVDCRSSAITYVPLPANASIVVIDTGVSRSLAASGYCDRFATCQRVVAALRKSEPGIRALRDVSVQHLTAVRHSLTSVDWMRAMHVVCEMERVPATVAAFREGNLVTAGALFRASHESLRGLYAVSHPALDAVVEQAMSHPACYGARLTGAGFGGCAIALVDAAQTEDFVQTVTERIRRVLPTCREVFAVTASEGATAMA